MMRIGLLKPLTLVGEVFVLLLFPINACDIGVMVESNPIIKSLCEFELCLSWECRSSKTCFQYSCCAKGEVCRWDATCGIGEQSLSAADTKADDNFGESVSISGDVAIIGASSKDEGRTHYAEAAYILEREENLWSEKQILRPVDSTAGDRFGYSVSVSGSVAIVGAWGEDSGGEDSGAAYIFKRENGVWIEEQKLKASDADAEDQFGRAVSIDGNLAIVGAWGHDNFSGAVYPFRYENGNWIEMKKIFVPETDIGDGFGSSLELRGDLAIIGAPWEDRRDETGQTEDVGAAYIFRLVDGEWKEEAKLTPEETRRYHWYGNSVSMSGDLALVGSTYEDVSLHLVIGLVCVYQYNPNFEPKWFEEQKKLSALDINYATENGELRAIGIPIRWFEISVTIDEDIVVVGASDNLYKGVAIVYERTGADWLKSSIKATDGKEYDRYGNAVDVSGRTIIVGAPGKDKKGIDSGAVYIY